MQGQTTITLHCAPGLIAQLGLDAGNTPGSNTSRRKMISESGPDRLDYVLYQDAGLSTQWGDTVGVDTREVLTTGAPQTVPVYGEIAGGQRVRDGTYSDVITVTVVF